MVEQTISSVTGTLASRRQKLIRYYARLSEQERLIVHAAQTGLMRLHRKGWRHSQESLAYCTLIRALDERYRLEHITTLRKAKSEDISKAERIWVEAVKARRSKPRKGEKRAQLFHHLPLIKKLVEKEGLSWREVAALLTERFQIKVAHSYVLKIYKDNYQSLAAPKGRPPALPPNGSSPQIEADLPITTGNNKEDGRH